jgi:SSS family solute:Na+ symporter
MILTGAGLYMVIMLGIGFYASRGSHSVTDFIVAGRSLPIWICSVSIFATWFGSGIMMGAATSGYDQDFLLMIGEPFGSGLALLLSGLFFARIMRRARRMTWVEFFEARYGKFAGVFGALTDILSGIIWLGGVLFTFGILLESLTGLPNAVGIFGGLIVIVIYTMVGGMWAVALTDFIQVAILTIGLVVLSVIVLNDVGGWGVIAEQLPKDAFRFFPFDHTYKNWIEYIHVWMTLGIAAIAANSVIQRALSARTEMVAQNSFLIAAVAYVVIGVIPIMLGMIASVTMPGAEDSNSILTDIAVAHMQPIFVVLFVGAILSSIMSTSDSILLSSASIISTNLLPRVIKNPGDALRLSVTRWSIPFIALAASYIAFGAERVVEVLIQSAAPLLAMTIVPFILCFWWEKANRFGALGGIFGGLAGWLISAQFDTVTPPDLIGFAVSLVIMVVVTLLTQRIDPPRPITDDQGNEVKLTNRVATFRSAS